MLEVGTRKPQNSRLRPSRLALDTYLAFGLTPSAPVLASNLGCRCWAYSLERGSGWGWDEGRCCKRGAAWWSE